MGSSLVLSLLTFTIFLIATSSSITIKPILINGTYNQWFNSTVNNTLEYIVVFNKSQTNDSTRVFVQSNDATQEAPLMVVVRQQREVNSWQLPLLVSSDSGKIAFDQTARTLCPSNVANISNLLKALVRNETEEPIISISTASKTNVTFNIRVIDDVNIFVNLSVLYNITISPSEPRYYYYDFSEEKSNPDANYDTVLLEVNSTNSVCMTVSIQNASCPVYDLNHDVTFQGYWETVDRQGGITITKDHFPKGFFVVFSAKGDDTDCVGTTKMIVTENRSKNISFIIRPSISYNYYVIAVLVTLTLIIATYFILIITFWWLSKKVCKPPNMTYVEDCDTETIQEALSPTSRTEPASSDNVSIDETEYDTIADLDYDRRIVLGRPEIFLSDLARKDPRVLQKKSYFYLWNVLTVAIFYGLPVIQLVIYYQNVLNDTGNQDLCYYNFLCAHPLTLFSGFTISDFNHLFSNVGYIMFGILFVFIVHRREKLHKDGVFDKYFGIPQHFGIYYAMGVALIMEGVLSGSYHICPNHSNFQFDSSFMYVMAVLCMVKLYQTRHPDINASAYATFGALAIAIVLGIIGILEANLAFWITFTVLHIIVCLLLTAQIYYFGYWKLDRGVFHRVYYGFLYDFRASSWSGLKPIHKGRMVLLVIGNLFNWGLAILGNYHHQRDFATYLLAILMSNTMLYFIFYIIMKFLHKERLNVQATMYLFLATACAISAIYFFYHKSISWALTPAGSRQFNKKCALFEFYDFHDIWHFLSAIGMFFTFMVLLTLDDDLSHTLRSKIKVF